MDRIPDLYKDNTLISRENGIFRLLRIKETYALVIDCKKRTMPVFADTTALSDYTVSKEQDIRILLGENADIELSQKQTAEAHRRYTIISGILPVIDDRALRDKVIAKISADNGISKQTIRKYLCTYLVYQDIRALAPVERITDRPLTPDEKKMRWGLNKFFYTKHKNTLREAYKMLLTAKYTDINGKLLPEYPSFYQFRYFFRKTKDIRKYYISRDGIKSYERNERPLLGDGVQEYCPFPGCGMTDSTVCDIYLINEAQQIVGRPILTASVDAYSGLCLGYSLSWEGGVYSLTDLALNMVSDKVEHCKKHGIEISDKNWPCKDILPARIISDMGSEYISATFEQITELGVSIENLPSYRPELKGGIEKFFDCIQNLYKPHLKGKGVIEPDFQERGAHDYRKDACLTMEDFEKVIIRCIIHYNCKTVKEGFPYTEDMLTKQIKPYAVDIWNYGLTLDGADMIPVTKEQIVLTLLPRTAGKFARNGLKVNKLRYKNTGFDEEYLSGREVTVAYNSNDVTFVWLIEKGEYIRFELIETRFKDKTLEEIEELRKRKQDAIKDEYNNSLQADIDLMREIKLIADNCKHTDTKVSLKDIRHTRKKQKNRTHKDFTKEISENE